MRNIVLTLFILFFTVSIKAQHALNEKYLAPQDPLVQKKLEHWQGLKFGLFMHWGTYSQWGIVESWSLCPEDEEWCKRENEFSSNYFEYVKAYENLQTTFNPINFKPERWVEAAKDAGMKYVVFTTKHHDGFCMFDTKQTDYKVTSDKCPFSVHPGSNITKEIFDVFRRENFLIGAYFSKPDWNSDLYWWRYFPPKNRNVSYDISKYPDRWGRFKEFTFNQIEELMTSYGKVDILWLDGGWVRPISSIDSTIVRQRGIKNDQDIDMKRIASMARAQQSGILVVDRTVSGEFENYVTPEQTVPERPLGIPWESCITMGDSWSYVPYDRYKSASQLIHLLINIVSKGGNLLLNIGPSPQGDWDETAYERLREIGVWMKVNGTAIYDSEPLPPYSIDNMIFAASKDKRRKYIYILSEHGQDHVYLPEKIEIKGFEVGKGVTIEILNKEDTKLKWVEENGKLVIYVPQYLVGKPVGKYAVVLKVIT